MGFNISPAVTITEKDSTLAARELGDYVGAHVGAFNWGPVDSPHLITSGESEMLRVFGKPTNQNYMSFMVAADFFSYSGKAWLYRTAGLDAKNAVPDAMAPVLVKNALDAENANLAGIPFLARYPGAAGNGLIVDICDTANWADWEFASAFKYRPGMGEYAIAVVDSLGQWSGAGALAQQEKLSISGKASGGIQQTHTITVTGTATGGVKQEETISVSGVATGTSLTAAGATATLVVGDSATIVATKLAAALAALTSLIFSAVATGTNIAVVFKDPGLRAKIVDVTSVGVSVVSTIDVPGNSAFTVVVNGETVALAFGDTAVQTASKLTAAVTSKSDKYQDITQPTTSKTRFTYVAYGPQAVTTPVTTNGLTFATVVDTPGVNTFTPTLFGVSVSLTNGDSSTTVATKLATALNAEVTQRFASIHTNRSNVVYNSLTTGKKVKQTAPVNQSGLVFSVDIVATGRLGTIVDRFELMTQTPNATFADGTSAYFATAMKNCRFVMVGDKTMSLSRQTITMQGGEDDNSNVSTVAGWKTFDNTEKYGVNYMFCGAIPADEQRNVADVADTRKDCFGFGAPMMSDVVNNTGFEMEAVLEWRTSELNKETSYFINVDNWGYVYDQYNDAFRWIPCCGGTAGLKARTDRDQNPWDSPAGPENGRYKNYVKIAWSANKETRDELYKVAVNSIVDFPGEGIQLYGDKTSLSRPSAFDHINVRSAFIVAEVSIAKLARYFLFKNNTTYTRAQFVNAIRPLLRGMVAKGAFEYAKLTADETNNPPEVRRMNKLIGDIKLMPVYSINYVELNFEATDSTVTFSEQA